MKSFCKIKTFKVYKLLFLGIVVLFVGLNIFNYYKIPKIERVLNSSSYSYLPYEAKNYIKSYYLETGQILLTEENKKENEPYLNPKYVEYLTLNDDEKMSMSLIPSEIITDYVSYGSSDDITEKYFNVESIDSDGDGIADKNFTSPMKNQGALGLCWAYTMVENAETLIMKEEDKSYTEGVTTLLSPRHLDYVTATFGFNEYINKYGNHTLGWGNNFSAASFVLANGLSFVDTSWKYNNLVETKKLEYADVFNDKLSLYELDSSIDFPLLNIEDMDLSKEDDLNTFNNYINDVKGLIKKYGSAYVATYAPGFSCSATNSEDLEHKVISVNSTCELEGPHAMQVIGWDDNYEYKYCINGSLNELWTSSCSSENTVSGKGAWILRNSWGEETNDKYTYLTYDSRDVYFNFITDLDSSENRKWDYIYNKSVGNIVVDSFPKGNKNEYVLSLNSGFDVNSKLEKIKFYGSSINSEYDIYYSESGEDNDYVFIENIIFDYSGFATIDLSNDDYKLNSKSKIKISSRFSINTNYVSVFTSDDSENKYISTNDLVYFESSDNLVDGLYKIHLYSSTYNIDASDNLSYKFFDSSANDITDKVIVENDVAYFNVLNPILYLPRNDSYFTVKIYHNDVELSSSILSVSDPTPKNGSGTIEDPYVIMTSDDLYSINHNLDAHYVLGIDIDLTYDTQNENGIYYNLGKGWTAIGYNERKAFTGSLDGRNHKIIGLSQTDGYGLFFYVETNNEDVYLKNIIFENAKINNSTLLAYVLSGRSNNRLLVENIAAINCEFVGSSNFISSNIKSSGKDAVVINSIFSNSVYKENSNQVISTLGQSAEVNDSTVSDASVNISNIQLLDKIENLNSYYFTGLIRFSTGNIKYSNIILNNNSKYTPYLFTRLSKSNGEKNAIFNNIYYLGSVNTYFFSDTGFYDATNYSSKTISELRDINNYINWIDFDKYWKFKDDGNSIPILKFVDFEYSYFDEINIILGDSVNVYDYVSPNIDAAKYLEFDTYNSDIIDVNSDGLIQSLKIGTDKFSVISKYDGTKKDVVVNVFDANMSVIKFDGNGSDGTMDDMIVEKDKEVSLSENKYSKEGYLFTGWNTKSDGSGISYVNSDIVTISDNLTLYAMWKPIKYQIKFISGFYDGSYIIQDFTYNVSNSLLSNTFIHSDKNYYFTGWNTKEDGSGISYFDEEVVLNLINVDGEVIELYAMWDNAKPVVKFSSNDELNLSREFEVSYNDSFTLPVNLFLKDGFKLIEWNTKSDGSGNAYYENEIITIKKNMTLYAIYEPIKFNIIYHSNDGTKITRVVNDIEYDSDVLAMDYDFSNPYQYTFIYWNTKPDGSGTTYNVGDKISKACIEDGATIDIYSIYKMYRISFDANGSEGSMEDILVYDGETASVPGSEFTKEGYNFKYYSINPDGSGKTYRPGGVFSKLTSDLKLYAYFEVASYPISYFKYIDGSLRHIETIYYNYEDGGEILEAQLGIDGYKFDSWNTEKDGSGDTYLPGDKVEKLLKSLSLYAIYKPINYKVRYNSNNGSGDTVEQNFVYDEEQALKNNEFEYKGYKFVKWNTKADGTGTSYTEGQVISNLVTVDGEIVELYAIYNPVSYKVIFNSNNGSGDTVEQDFIYDEEQELKNNEFEYEGYKFIGWNTKADGSGTGYTDKHKVSNLVESGSITLFAIWESSISYNINEYNVDDEKNIIDNIPINTSLDDYKKNIVVGPLYSFEIDIGDKKNIFTGSKLKIYKGSELIVEYTNIVRGDVNRDGSISALDYVKVKNHIMKSSIISDFDMLLAADANSDNGISALDYVRIKNIILGGSN